MEFIMEMVPILLPLIIVGGIAIFVVLRLKQKYKRGTLGKKNTKAEQDVLDSLIPLGMLIGSMAGVVVSIVFAIPPIHVLSLAAGIGLLLGYIAYEFYSRKEGSYS